MGLCGCAEKHDAAEELEELTLEGESDVGKNSKNSKTESEKGSQGGTDAEEGLPETLYVHVCGAVNAPGVYELRTDARIGSGRWNDRRCCRRLDQSGRSFE